MLITHHRMPRRDEILQKMNELKIQYAAARQEQVFQKIHELNEDELTELLNDLQVTDPEEVNRWYQRTIGT
jgi:molybdopterin converting factor small subunit